MVRTREIVATAPVELTHLLVGGNLASDGVQWSTEVVTVTAKVKNSSMVVAEVS